MPVSPVRHLQPLENPHRFDHRSAGANPPDVHTGRSPADGGPRPAPLSPAEDECFSEWLVGRQQGSDSDASLWDEPRWEEPPARLVERLVCRLRRKSATG